MSRSTETTKYFTYITGQILVQYQLNKHIRYKIAFVKRSLCTRSWQENQNIQHNHYSFSSLDTTSVNSFHLPSIQFCSIKFILMFSFQSLLGHSSRRSSKKFPTKIPNVFLDKKYCSTILMKHLILIPLKKSESDLCLGSQKAQHLLHHNVKINCVVCCRGGAGKENKTKNETCQFIYTQYLGKGHTRCPSCSLVRHTENTTNQVTLKNMF